MSEMPVKELGVIRGSANEEWVCTLCASAEKEPLIEKSGYFYVSCKGCGVAILDPLPDTATLESMYEDFLELECDGVKMSDHFSPEYKASYFKEKDLDFVDLSYSPPASVRLLDIGCADGIFLRYMKERHSVDGEGIDVSLKMVKAAQSAGFDCSNKKLEDLSGGYGLITLWDTIEHLRDPKESLKEVCRLLDIGGDLIIQTPCRGEASDAWGVDWIQYQPPYHTFLFTEAGLARLLEECGFSVTGSVRFGAGVTESGNTLKPIFDSVVKGAGIGDTIVIRATKR